ncbi:DUF2304 domain-containing protein [Leucobacter ruminantium]|uniref:DUF2304 domain-containing protein n=1 Tax=Leucobacter ruminantium TaxID=1289170 RepID=A0A939RZJ0_9MICO|nr:DUF2304 domain-containing protein [Leucobacter ruminantium]MBO1805539.1 DUF2304 domain-containing protein [Leucobacter ruminantium]
MTVFQLLLIAVIAIGAIFALRLLSGDRSLAVKRMLAILFAVCAVLAILFPQLLTWVANLFGIGRGADLLLYVFVLASLVFALISVRTRARQDARVTELARSVALMEARLSERQDEGR